MGPRGLPPAAPRQVPASSTSLVAHASIAHGALLESLFSIQRPPLPMTVITVVCLCGPAGRRHNSAPLGDSLTCREASRPESSLRPFRQPRRSNCSADLSSQRTVVIPSSRSPRACARNHSGANCYEEGRSDTKEFRRFYEDFNARRDLRDRSSSESSTHRISAFPQVSWTMHSLGRGAATVV
ncbi:hypothetical protein OH77DRAFT_1254324 [Trametes cingulata]|nr:hypothetical protein OH77DRAFT_1254324 [Trametes cingulata]